MFRRYYYSSGYYRVCLNCEKINSRVKYLERKGDRATQAEREELAKIAQLYEYQRAAGLKPPRRRIDAQRAIDDFDALLEKYKRATNVGTQELTAWLTAELTRPPEYYNEVVYEQLLIKYRPVLRVDPATLTPVYDNTHIETLNKILERFNDYEDEYYK